MFRAERIRAGQESPPLHQLSEILVVCVLLPFTLQITIYIIIIYFSKQTKLQQTIITL